MSAPASASGAGGEGAGDEQQRTPRVDASPEGEREEEIVSIDEVNWLVVRLGIPHKSPLYSLNQCSSSFFVILFQHTFDMEIVGLDNEPDTQEKKLENVRGVVQSLQHVFHRSLGYISPERIIQQDQLHISRLISVFLDVVMHIDGEGGSEGGSVGDGPNDTRKALVDKWIKGLVPPQNPRVGGGAAGATQRPAAAGRPHTAGGAGRVEGGVSDVRGRLKRVEEAGSRPVGTVTAAAVCRVFTSADDTNTLRHLSTRTALFTPQRLDNRARDSKIERLRSQRFLQSLNHDVMATIKGEASKRELKVKTQVEQQLKQEQEHYLEIRRLAKEEDERMRHIYADAVHSAKASAAQSARVHRDVAAHVEAQERRRHVAQQLAVRARAQQRAVLNREYERHIDSLYAWRRYNHLF